MFSRLLLLCVAAAAVLPACKLPAGSSPQVVTASSTIGTTGGTVTLSDGTTLSIPSGALSATTKITVTSNPTAPVPANAISVGPAYTLQPEGLTFSIPITLTLLFAPSSLPAGKTSADVVIFTAPIGTTNFQNLGGTLSDATHVQAQTTHFSYVQPGVSTSASSSDAGSGGVDGGPCPACANGLCAAACPGSQANCGGTCTDTSSDSQNCGACGTSCPNGKGCSAGVCVASCGSQSGSGCVSSGPSGLDGGTSACCSGFTSCSGICIDPTSDPQNCGACGTACGAGEQCMNSVCSPVCPNGATCYDGLCVASCPAGTSSCSGGTCADTSNDPENCGSCGHECGDSQVCYQGACVASCGNSIEGGCAPSSQADGGSQCCPGETSCGNNCADLGNDPQNCGACNNACPAGDVCNAGVCGPVCPSGHYCYNSACVPACPAGASVCGGNCVDTQNDSQNCGACNSVCPSGDGCLQGTCAASCGSTTVTTGGGVSNGGPDAG